MDKLLRVDARMRSSNALFFASWVIASMAAVMLTFGLILASMALTKVLHVGVDEDQFFGALIFPLMSTLLGVGQWLVLRTRLPQSGKWVIATIAGMLIGILLGLTLGQSLTKAFFAISGQSWSWDTSFHMMYVFIGMAMGLAQWLVLRRHVALAALWLPITVAGWLALNLLIGRSIDIGPELVMFGFIPALFTGAGLLWLLHHTHG